MVYSIYFEQTKEGDDSVLALLCRCFRLFYASGHFVRGKHKDMMRSAPISAYSALSKFHVVSVSIEGFCYTLIRLIIDDCESICMYKGGGLRVVLTSWHVVLADLSSSPIFLVRLTSSSLARWRRLWGVVAHW